ncbi:MAG: hypothetical protein ABIH52_01850 [Candidatus Aenigmatarchaeota archaeon]
MSTLRKIEIDNDDILITLELTKHEYSTITPNVKEFVTLPADTPERLLTTGRLGNGNRIMVPNKFLKSNNIQALRKNVPSKIFDLGDRKFLIIELESSRPEPPVFKD